MKCDLCQSSKNLLSDATKATLRPYWAGVDFYNVICAICWNKQLEEI